MLEFDPVPPELDDYEPVPPALDDLPKKEVIVNGMPESEFIALAQQEGDQEAFAVIFEQHRPRVSQKVGWTPHREDVLQDTYIRGWNGFEGFKDRGAGMFPWLGRIAYNRAVELWRRDQRITIRPTNPLDTGSVLYTMPDPEASIDQVLTDVVRHVNPEAIARVLKIVEDEVGLDAARLLRVVGIDGRPLGDYAEVAEVAPMTANSRAHRIRRKLGQEPTRSVIFSVLQTEGIL